MEPIEILVNEDIKIHEGVKLRSKQDGIHSYASETMSGDEWSHCHQIWVIKTRVIDKIHD